MASLGGEKSWKLEGETRKFEASVSSSQPRELEFELFGQSVRMYGELSKLRALFSKAKQF